MRSIFEKCCSITEEKSSEKAENDTNFLGETMLGLKIISLHGEPKFYFQDESGSQGEQGISSRNFLSNHL